MHDYRGDALPGERLWGVFVSGPHAPEFLLGSSKHSFDADCAAEALANGRKPEDVLADPTAPGAAETCEAYMRAATNTLLHYTVWMDLDKGGSQL